MAKISNQVLESMARIGYSEKPLMDWIDERISDLTEKMLYQPDEAQLRVLQGRTQEMVEFRKQVKNAPELLRKA